MDSGRHIGDTLGDVGQVNTCFGSLMNSELKKDETDDFLRRTGSEVFKEFPGARSAKVENAHIANHFANNLMADKEHTEDVPSEEEEDEEEEWVPGTLDKHGHYMAYDDVRPTGLLEPVKAHPFVAVGMLATLGALVRGLYSMGKGGDGFQMNKFMRQRVSFQAGVVAVLVGSVMYTTWRGSRQKEHFEAKYAGVAKK